MTARAPAIRTEADALAYIASLVELGSIRQPEIEDGKVLQARRCTRCGGTGRFLGMNSSGVCFGCYAQPSRMTWNEWVPVVEWARNLRKKVRARELQGERRSASVARAHAAQREFHAAQGLGELTTREVYEASKASRVADREAVLALREHVGTVGAKLELEVTFTTWSEANTRFGRLFIYRFLDAAGNLIVWKTSVALDLEERTRVVLAATVKQHDYFRDEAQTVVTRAKIVRQLGAEVIDRETLAAACDFAEAQGWTCFAFVDRATLNAGTASDETLRRLADHPAIRRALQRMGCARAAA